MSENSVEQITSVLQQAPQRIYCDNGAEFVSAAMDLWVYTNGVILDFASNAVGAIQAVVHTRGTPGPRAVRVDWCPSTGPE